MGQLKNKSKQPNNKRQTKSRDDYHHQFIILDQVDSRQTNENENHYKERKGSGKKTVFL